MEDDISLGRMLSTLRENLGLTQEDIACKIHVRKAVVVDIENDQLVHAPLVFIKGYIRSYAEIVGLSVEEYQHHLDSLAEQYVSNSIKNHAIKYKKSKRGKISLFVFLCVLGVILYYVTKESKSNYVEVSHYISPSLLSKHVNS
ncbi:hypothetical protein A9G33_05880 [Gilliamella sp. Choc3-5]|uniref:helix-turn-helix domain-containing protein n=1 Tax=Gilliamella sp. Choc3-5 TaxID=3120236 RepID=UPI00080E51C9|nr:helix-turn-helix domain-containing protein [Gilliamella apicola]OCG31182.1 hypothetical protein A9G33_05880 [Gilliamella apicola]